MFRLQFSRELEVIRHPADDDVGLGVASQSGQSDGFEPRRLQPQAQGIAGPTERARRVQAVAGCVEINVDLAQMRAAQVDDALAPKFLRSQAAIAQVERQRQFKRRTERSACREIGIEQAAQRTLHLEEARWIEVAQLALRREALFSCQRQPSLRGESSVAGRELQTGDFDGLVSDARARIDRVLRVA